MKPPTVFEKQVLDVVLTELRRVMKTKGQLSVLIDPWCNGETGCYMFATSGPTIGRRYEIARAPTKRRRVRR